MAAPSALTLCNACDLDDMHHGCEAGYCAGCCPVHGKENR
jgi:hypothetical protein